MTKMDLRSHILDPWDHRLNYDEPILTTGIKLTDECILLSGKFSEKLEFKMRNQNLLQKNRNYLWLNPI